MWRMLALVIALSATGASGGGDAPPQPRVFMAVYERGPRWLPEKNVFDQPTMREHVAHHEALGPRLLAAGPLQVEGTDTTVGVVLLIATSPEEAAKWLADDPAVKAQVMMGKIREWRVSKIQAFSRETAPSR